jgi:hypothetical protein
MRMTENPKIRVFVRTSNPSGFFVQPDRGGGAVVTGAVSHARNHVVAVEAEARRSGHAVRLHPGRPSPLTIPCGGESCRSRR